MEIGYPKKCTKCSSLSGVTPILRVKPYLKKGTKSRIMLIGQDPTIYRNPERVEYVLMLDQEKGQLRRWLTGLLGVENFQATTLYATNLVKCSFEKPPYTTLKGTMKFLKPYFELCKSYLIEEITKFKPHLVLTLGEPAHRLFINCLDNAEEFDKPMKDAFAGKFREARLRSVKFQYSPCLHIKTFRVAETYGDKTKEFKKSLTSYFK